MNLNEDFSAQAKAWVLFCDVADKYPLRLLKKGFRHCALLLIHNGYAVVIDPLSTRLICDVVVVRDEDDFINKIKARMYVVAVEKKSKILSQKPFHLRPLSCVEVVKHALGIRNFFIFTPFQLYKFLTKKSEQR